MTEEDGLGWVRILNNSDGRRWLGVGEDIER